MKKIDIHCHTTNRSVKDILPASAGIETLLSEMKAHDVEKTVLLATYFPHRESGISNFRMHHWIKDRPEFAMFGSLDFEHYFKQGMNELYELSEGGLIKGIKIYTGYQRIDLESANFREVLGLARKQELPVMFHCGFSYSSMRQYGKPAITVVVGAKMLEPIALEYPSLVFILSHLAKPATEELISVLKRAPNVYTDMSGLVDSKFDKDEIPDSIESIRKVLGECGPKKLLFGTDFPVQTHDDSVYFIEQAMKDYSLKDKEDVYYNNARRLLR